MLRVPIIVSLALLLAGCSRVNPVSPITDTINSGGLRATFSISQETYGIHDTLTGSTSAYNPGRDTVRSLVPVCWPISWYKVVNSAGATVFSYTAPTTYGCNSIIDYSVLPHQTKQIPLLWVRIPIDSLRSVQPGQGPYTLKLEDGFGEFSVRFTVY